MSWKAALAGHLPIALLIAGFAALRLLVAPSFGLGVDEAHYVLYGIHLDWSYVDHPPLVGWIHAAFQRLCGPGELAARLPAILLFALATAFLYGCMLRISGSRSTAFLAALAVNSSFLFNALGLMLLPETLLVALIFPLLRTIQAIEKAATAKRWACLGVLLGLAGLAKYTAILFVPPLFAYLLFRRRWDLACSWGMVLAGLIALACVSPVLHWNLAHDWISFRYQAGNVLGGRHLDPAGFVQALAAQFGAYSPFLFVIAFYGFARSLRTPGGLVCLCVLFGGAILAFVLYSSLFEAALPHWSGLFYLLCIPLGVWQLRIGGRPWQRRLLRFSLGISLFLTLLAYAELGGKWIPFPDYRSPFRDIYGYETIAREANALLRQDGGRNQALAVTNWTLASRLMVYSRPYGHEVFVLDRRTDQFDLWQETSPVGRDLLVLLTHFEHPDLSQTCRCDAVEPAKSFHLLLNGSRVDTAMFAWCRNYQGEKRAPAASEAS